MPAAPQLVEFPDALGFGAPLFVQCAWRDVGSDAVESDTAVCDLVMHPGRCNHPGARLMRIPNAPAETFSSSTSASRTWHNFSRCFSVYF